jgi:hypothetical protein
MMARPALPEPPPSFGAVVALPAPVAGQDARAFAAKERAAIVEANSRLRNDRSFYSDVQSKFGGS